ncbi:MAG: DUF4332 domain-containing protein [Candidatus Methanoperedens sp.]
MKRFQSSKYVLFALFTALLFTGGAVAQECDVPNALLKAQLYNDALTNYTDLLNQNPNSSCAQKGIQDAQRFLTIKSYEIGQAYENASQFNEARIAYIETLKTYPNYIPAQEALEKVSDDKFAAVQTLANLGYYTEATARLKKVVEDNPGTKMPKDLDYLPGRSIFLWGYIRNWIEIWGQPLAEIVIFLLGLYVLRYRIGPWMLGLFKIKWDIKEFNTAPDLDIGKGMMAMVEGSFMQIGKESGHEHLHLVSEEYQDLNKIPADIKAGSPHIMWASNLIEWIFPSKVIMISGYLEKPGIDGVGLTLSTVNSLTGEILGNITLWQKDYDTEIKPIESTEGNKNLVSSYYYLVEPAAIWVFFQLNEQRRAGKDTEKFTLLGTDDWKSYAHFQAGIRWQLEGKKDKARQQYVIAQNQDMNNYGALINLGYLDIEEKNYNRAIERLSKGIEMAEKSKNYPKERAWFVAMYQLAAAYHYKGRLLRKEPVCALQCIEDAEKQCQKLLNKINEEKFLESIEPNASIMHASILIELAYLAPGEIDQNKKDDAEKKIKSIESEYSKLAPRVRYNLACYYSIVGDKTKEDEQKNNYYNKALDNLIYAIEGGGDLIQWAKIDPSLEGARKFKGTKEDFDKLIQKYSPKEKSDSSDLPLAGLAIIKEAYARQLKEQGIICHYDLILKAESLQEQQTLAKKIGISPKLLRRWALLADLMRIVGNTDYVNLLEAADLGSLEALKKVSDPYEVVNLLNQINQVQSLVKTLPAIEIVNQWIQEAKKIKIKVQ